MSVEHPNIDNRPDLPEIFPEQDVTVEGEEHTFLVSETDSGTESQLEYTLDKAPVKEVVSVQGIDQNGDSRTFSNGTDYTLESKTDSVVESFIYDSDKDEYNLTYEINIGSESVEDDSGDTYVEGTDYFLSTQDEDYAGTLLVWEDGGDTPDEDEEFTVTYDVTFNNSLLQWDTSGDNLPQADSKFYVTYRADSVIGRYLDSGEDELSHAQDKIEKAISEKFIDSASNERLDEIGKLFGPVIGKRRGRSERQYRIYLRSVVQSLVSRGTVNGIKTAVSAATGVPIEDITIDENFTDVSYEVVVIPETPVRVSTLEDIAEAADPSGVDLVRSRFPVFEDVAVDDSTNSTRGFASDQMASDDAFTIDPNKFSSSDQMASDDATATSQSTITWDSTNWDDTDWTAEHN